jgi:hypothetical protein
MPPARPGASDDVAPVCCRTPNRSCARRPRGASRLRGAVRPRLAPIAPLYDLDTFEVLSVFADIEQKLGVTFTDDDIEFIETEGELVSRAAAALMRAGS